MLQPSELFGSVTVTRYGSGSVVAGEWSEGTPSTLTITANVQPMPPERMRVLEEGKRGEAGIIIYTDTALRTVSEANQTSPDRVTWAGYLWDVVGVDDLSTGMTLAEAHYEVLAVRK